MCGNFNFYFLVFFFSGFGLVLFIDQIWGNSPPSQGPFVGQEYAFFCG